ncbi:hypothetical protein BX616_006182 [Lobosporangium transversale]|uniref:Uncharacterized protein n=1 Tax=Lobosporangium transversale TaxID=64571 RepID=A0A1Y2GIM4_9FUNG|nr:hypothetical protein BCR41DRAFT_356440 [Lobosporangium transversale]KAF9915426.1 hypothetical protein BX616_006182 [Lobosporangium transversale]ORZ12063.1 hypothetical protein BCR41DRAFT_356440 [Lobosporangium transversale]|eukprot:XP_021879928.1 hypothetical protein BCR41DRAFT_356440 [Lobosporangium transversale]
MLLIKNVLFTLSALTLFSTSRFSHYEGGAALVMAALTPQERIEVEAKNPENPNYCPACLQKAMSNHFPHACPKGIEPMNAHSRPEGPTAQEQRCVCVAFRDLYWMKLDCQRECAFVNDPEAMTHFLPSDQIPGCDQWIDFETGEEKDVEGFDKRDPAHVPEKFEAVAADETPDAQANTEEEKGKGNEANNQGNTPVVERTKEEL